MTPIFRSNLLGMALAMVPLAVTAQEWPRTIPHEDGALVLTEPPQRVVSVAPSLTGTLLAIDAPVVATAAAMKGQLADDDGFFLQWADVAHERGVEVLYPNLAFDMEALIVSEPDLVVGSSVGGDSILPYLSELKAQEIPVLVVDYSTHRWQEIARMLGRATDRTDQAEAAIRTFDERAARAAERIGHPDGPVTIVSYNFGGTYAIGKPSSPQAEVLSALGFTVVGLPPELRGAVTRSADFDFISHENLAAAITGDTVFLLSGTEQTVEAFKKDPILANLPAVRENRVYSLGPASFRVDYYSALGIVDTVEPHFTK